MAAFSTCASVRLDMTRSATWPWRVEEICGEQPHGHLLVAYLDVYATITILPTLAKSLLYPAWFFAAVVVVMDRIVTALAFRIGKIFCRACSPNPFDLNQGSKNRSLHRSMMRHVIPLKKWEAATPVYECDIERQNPHVKTTATQLQCLFSHNWTGCPHHFPSLTLI